ncbi:diphthine--ammonia ligase [Mangrovibacterium sp.]|uniref:Dph6-related ATP pyrophosphatase n=1 Tax=Mangrovibacterium sp. TaxID=1961364 RepID=UPI003564B098
MNVFVSWSGGKDCMLALHRTLKGGSHRVLGLLNMCDRDTQLSRSHGLKKELLQRQAAAMGIRLIQQETDGKNYEKNFKAAIAELKNEGLEAGVFGDIYLMEHRTWIERVCHEMGIEALFPIWGDSTNELARELVIEGFRPLVVAVRNEPLPKTYLGRIFDAQMIAELEAMDGVDICAENGEFHSFVIDGPIFQHPVDMKTGEIYFENKHWYLSIN